MRRKDGVIEELRRVCKADGMEVLGLYKKGKRIRPLPIETKTSSFLNIEELEFNANSAKTIHIGRDDLEIKGPGVKIYANSTIQIGIFENRER